MGARILRFPARIPEEPLPNPVRKTVPTGALALLGHPVGHSLSPLIHNTALRTLGHDPRYVACDVLPADLVTAVRGLAALGFVGANVTIPYKEAVLPLVDRLTERARAVGAVNTLNISPAGTIEGDNTDEAGFAAPLESFAGSISGRDVVVFGAGGAARAVLFALLTRYSPRRLTVLGRRPEQAASLCAAFATRAGSCELRAGTLSAPGGRRAADNLDSAPAQNRRAADTPADAGASSGRAAGTRRSEIAASDQEDLEAVRSASLVVNATPLGMSPQVDSTPWTDASIFSAGQLVYDLVYRPAETRLLREARAAGAHGIGGLPMLIAQAATAFEVWTGQPMPLEAVTRAVEAALAPA